MRFLAYAYNSYLLSMAIAVTLFGITWLEMRINMGHIFFALWAALFIINLLVFQAKKMRMPMLFTLTNTVICITYGFVLLGARRMGVVPASIIRKGLQMPYLPFSTVNTAMVALLAICFVGLLAHEIADRKKLKS